MDKALTTKQLAFVEFYLTCWNETEAARRAGYANPNNNAHRLMVNDGIKAAIQERLAELKMGADEVLARISDHARSSIADFVDVAAPSTQLEEAESVDEAHAIVSGWRLNLAKAKQSGKLHLIKKLKSSQWGPEIELHDPQTALTLIGKHHGLFVEKIDISHQEIEKFLDKLRDNLPPDEYARIVALAAGETSA